MHRSHNAHDDDGEHATGNSPHRARSEGPVDRGGGGSGDGIEDVHVALLGKEVIPRQPRRCMGSTHGAEVGGELGVGESVVAQLQNVDVVLDEGHPISDRCLPPGGTHDELSESPGLDCREGVSRRACNCQSI